MDLDTFRAPLRVAQQCCGSSVLRPCTHPCLASIQIFDSLLKDTVTNNSGPQSGLESLLLVRKDAIIMSTLHGNRFTGIDDQCLVAAVLDVAHE